MASSFDILDLQVSTAIAASSSKTAEELRKMIVAINSMLPAIHGCEPVDEEDVERLAREIEERTGVDMGLGAMVDGDDFEPWLDDVKSKIDPFYWERYRRHTINTGLPKNVVTGIDEVTDRILSRLGNPNKNVPWSRRGMVVGHVQSGKTANYAGLICKAADAGYRLIIVIAGIHNNLRNQTQQRIDEGFIGRDTGRHAKGGKGVKKVGVGLLDERNTPVSLTTTIDDFKKSVATTNKSQIDSYKVPVVLVIKKNSSTLKNLIDWLKENSAHGDSEMVSQPMLLIDDEADNASINTKFNKEEVTRINGQIRELLNSFHRSCYVGYTATPFANIFIDPDQDHEVHKEDLFPRDFIIGLDAPTNYFGGRKVFIDGIPDEGRPEYVRYITDNEDILPIQHTIDFDVAELPPSLHDALRAFLLARTIRNLRGQAGKHSSMLVNASRFTRVQGLIRNRLHEKLEDIRNALRVHGATGSAALRDSEIAELHRVWSDEYVDAGFGWNEILPSMYEAVAAAKAVEVNSSRNDLDYSDSSDIGLTIIAVGGFSLSRGLTLEGLTTTWFLRNTMMYDTLMQMGRWFGYRPGYEDLCRVWMPHEAVSWYSHIAEATDELHVELRRMQDIPGATPLQFGLAVRSHPSALMVTARNKLGSGEKTVSIGLSSNFVETARLSSRKGDLDKNRKTARTLLAAMDEAGFRQATCSVVPNGFLTRGVSVRLIDDFLRDWINSDLALTTQIDPIRKYIDVRSATELAKWDVLVSSLKTGEPTDIIGWPLVPMQRKIGKNDLVQGAMSIGGDKMRVSTRSIERTGLDEQIALECEAAYVAQEKKPAGKKPNYPGFIYREVRERPLLALYLVSVNSPEGADLDKLPDFPHEPVVAWAISFPKSERPDEKVEYIINKTRQRELFGNPSDHMDDDDE